MKKTSQPIAGDDQVLKNIFKYEKLFKTHFLKMKDPLSIVLKGHLLLEVMLLDMIALHCKDPNKIISANLPFSVKLKICQALIGVKLFTDEMYMIAEVLNKLRNEFSHDLEGVKVDVKLEEFVRCVSKQYSLKNMDEQKKSKELKKILAEALGYYSGYFSAMHIDIKSERYNEQASI